MKADAVFSPEVLTRFGEMIKNGEFDGLYSFLNDTVDYVLDNFSTSDDGESATRRLKLVQVARFFQGQIELFTEKGEKGDDA